jgi:HD domain-containing protein
MMLSLLNNMSWQTPGHVWTRVMDMRPIDNRMLAGIQVPATPVVDRAIEYARQKCEPYLFNHVVRSWLFAARIGQLKNIEHDAEVVAVGTLLHDITLNDRFAGPRRFEVEGADLARDFATDIGFDKRRAQLIWDSVALNSTPSIGLYKEAEVALCTAGVCLDVVGLRYEVIPSDEMKKIVDEFPRLGMKSKMTRCFCGIAQRHPQTTYDNFMRDFGERFVPGYKAPSSVDFVANAPFDE